MKTGTSSDYVDDWYMGVTKDLIAGVWVGCDEQSIHFKNSATGEGSKTALPIYAMFMEEIYKHPEFGVTFGKFPEPKVKITKTYQCPTPRIIYSAPVDSTQTDIDPELDSVEGSELNEGVDPGRNTTTTTTESTIEQQ